MLAPLFSVLLVAAGASIKWFYDCLKSATLVSFPDLREASALFVQRAVTDVQTTMFENPDPTSVEFEQIFGRAMDAALTGKRKIILVIDNLDRLDGESALVIWSTLQTFLHQSTTRPRWIDRLWVILPYDSAAFMSVFSKGGSPAATSASAFLDKSFQVRLEVPPPLLSDWRTYLLDLLGEVLPNHDPTEFELVYRVLVLAHGGVSYEPTPRALKVFANQLGALHRQHQHTVPLPLMAYYSFLRESGEKDVVAGVREGHYPRPVLRRLLGPEAGDYMAALQFGVDRHSAQQLLLTAPIRVALANGDGARLAGLCEASGGFWDVLEHVVDEVSSEWVGDLNFYLPHALRALHGAALADKAPARSWEAILEALREALDNVRFWGQIPDFFADAVHATAWLYNDRDLTHRMVVAYADTTALPGGFDALPSDRLSARISDISALMSFVTESNDLYEGPGFVIPGGYADLVAALSVFGRELSLTRQQLLLLKPLSVKTEQLVAVISGGEFGEADAAAITFLVHCAADIEWPLVVSAITTRLESTTKPQETRPLLSSVLALRSHAGAANAPTVSSISSLYETASRANDLVARALCMFIHMEKQPAFNEGSHRSYYAPAEHSIRAEAEAPPEGLAEALATLLMDYSRPDLLWNVLEKAPVSFRALWGQVAAALAEDSQFQRTLSPATVITHWEFLTLNLKTGFLRYVTEADTVYKLVRSQDFDLSRVPLYIEMLRSADASREEFKSWLHASILTLSHEVWTAQLVGVGRLVDLAVALRESNAGLFLKDKYLHALETVARRLADGKDKEVGHPRDVLLSLLDTDYRMNFTDHLVRITKEAGGNLPDEYWNLVGDEMFEALARNPDSADAIIIPVIRQSSPAGLRWVVRFAAAHPSWKTDLSKRKLRLLRDTVESALKESTPVPDELRSLAQALRFRIADV